MKHTILTAHLTWLAKRRPRRWNEQTRKIVDFLISRQHFTAVIQLQLLIMHNSSINMRMSRFFFVVLCWIFTYQNFFIASSHDSIELKWSRVYYLHQHENNDAKNVSRIQKKSQPKRREFHMKITFWSPKKIIISMKEKF